MHKPTQHVFVCEPSAPLCEPDPVLGRKSRKTCWGIVVFMMITWTCNDTFSIISVFVAWSFSEVGQFGVVPTKADTNQPNALGT